MGELPQQLIVQAALILLNAFFAATEIAVISLNTAKLRRLQETGDKTAGRLLRMAEEPAGFLSTIQIPGQRVRCGELLRQPDKLDL